MTTAALLVAALLAVAAVLFAARPFLLPSADDDAAVELGEGDRERLQLLEERDRALGALKELEFDHRTGKISDADYRELVGPLRREAAEALAALESAGSAQGAGDASPAGRGNGTPRSAGLEASDRASR